jgi:heterodisulfide reductase subunit C
MSLVIRPEDLKKELVEELNEWSERSLIKCMDCGLCSSSCHSGRRTSLSVRRVLRLARLGCKGLLDMKELWMCTTCYACYDRCPRKVNTVDVIIKLRNMAFREGKALEPHKRVAKLFVEYGHAVPISDEVKALRKSLGLPEVPPTVHSYPEALDEVKKIVEKTSFTKLV